MTRRISSSRPMTGSSLPARASAVRSRPYFSRAWYVPSGFGEVTRWPPRTLCSAPRIGLAAGAVALEQLLALAADLGDAEEQVLGRDVLVAEAPGLVLGALDDALRARVERQRAALDPGAPGRGSPASSPRNAGRSTPSRRSVSAGMPSSGSTSAARMCSASRTGLSRRLGELPGRRRSPPAPSR